MGTHPDCDTTMLELKDDHDRELAKEAMLLLWRAMDLRNPGMIILPSKPNPSTRDLYYRMFRFVGETLLGKDCPDPEQYT